jgi:hypothetical protein
MAAAGALGHQGDTSVYRDLLRGFARIVTDDGAGALTIQAYED